MSTTTIVKCDVCGSDGAKQTEMQIIFTTEQSDGRGIKPYFCIDKFDLCIACLDTALTGRYIFASGAQGYNHYWFHSPNPPASEPRCTTCHSYDPKIKLCGGGLGKDCPHGHEDCHDSFHAPPAYFGDCPKCGAQLGFGHLPEECQAQSSAPEASTSHDHQ